MIDPHEAKTPRASGTWGVQHDAAIMRAHQMRELALKSIDSRSFAMAVSARTLQLKGESLAEMTNDWKRLPPDNEFRLAAITELFAYASQVESLLKEAEAS